jgi:hypothetical protein
MKKIILTALVLIVFVILVTPWLLYAIGLRNVDGRPPLPLTSLTTDEAKSIWDKFGETGPVCVKRIGPWDFVLRFLVADPEKGSPGDRVAWFVARDWNAAHLLNRRMISWHLSGAAMVIWLTRNWTTDQILGKAKELRRERPEGT